MSGEHRKSQVLLAMFGTGTMVAFVLAVLLLWLRTRRRGADEWFLAVCLVEDHHVKYVLFWSIHG